VRKRLGRREGAFNLGRFELPVAISALLWVVAALFVITVPKEAFVPDLIVVGLIVAGGLYFLGLLMFRREVLETEPGEVNLFEMEASRAGGGSVETNETASAAAVLGEGGIDGLSTPAGRE